MKITNIRRTSSKSYDINPNTISYGSWAYSLPVECPLVWESLVMNRNIHLQLLRVKNGTFRLVGRLKKESKI